VNILIFHNAILPVTKYGGTERIIWWLGKELSKKGHKITFLAAEGSKSSFAEILIYEPNLPLNKQIPVNIDVIHLDHKPLEPMTKPYVVVIHGNSEGFEEFDINTIFVSQNHAERHQSKAFVYNGIDLDDYGIPDFKQKRTHLHFLGKASWRVKNVKGAIELARQSHNKLAVLGGKRLNIKMGFRFTPYPNIRFFGMVGGEEKNHLINASKGLLFPVLWHEPFGIAIIESLYFGCPVFGTPYGSLPELVLPEVGFLSAKKTEIIAQLGDIEHFSSKICHEYVADNFTMKRTAEEYLKYYEKVLNGKKINLFPPKAFEIPPKFLPFI
jgi:glycosyltransferase involved in cell wall biosynthesis